jgi:hypothetical protein
MLISVAPFNSNRIIRPASSVNRILAMGICGEEPRYEEIEAAGP